MPSSLNPVMIKVPVSLRERLQSKGSAEPHASDGAIPMTDWQDKLWHVMLHVT